MRLNIFSKRIIDCLQTVPCLVLCLFLNIEVVFASAMPLAPSVQTNKNVVTTEFNDHIENKGALDVQVEEFRNIGAKDAENPNLAEFLSEEEIGKLDSEKGRLSSVRDTDLETEGRKVRYSEENVHFNDFETDYTKAGAIAHKKDAEAIIDATEQKIGELTALLRKNGLDCTEAAKSPEIKDPYYIEIEKEEIKEVDYDQKFCESLMNNYQCTESLKLNCIGRNWMPIVDNFATSGLPKYYNTDTSDLTFGWNRNLTLHGGYGREFDYVISFSIPSKDDIAEFILREIGFDDYIKISVNGTQIYPIPPHSKDLALCHGGWGWGRGHASIKLTNEEGCVHSAERNTWWREYPNKDIKPYLVSGANTINIRVIVGGGGGVWLRFSAKQKGCTSWKETWEELCTHRK